MKSQQTVRATRIMVGGPLEICAKRIALCRQCQQFVNIPISSSCGKVLEHDT
ncbi:hypothetical protein [Vreelandella nanhaiensis]|uniref:hypothetical protein n=1 Tax=Vreelandella nanhaiensis TaxID=1258546 RepID=UPI00163CCCBA|nr:hypothetical protein [Halomonas nanhaiensis]